jgi:hypothetical protein
VVYAGAVKFAIRCPIPQRDKKNEKREQKAESRKAVEFPVFLLLKSWKISSRQIMREFNTPNNINPCRGFIN